MPEETTEHYPLWIPPTYCEEGLYEPSEYTLDDWSYAHDALGDLFQMALNFDNKAFLLALEDAQDRVGIELEGARRRARGAA